MVSDKKIFRCFPYISQCNICDPRGRAIFDPRGIIHKVMLHTKYHGSWPNGFRQEDFSTCFSLFNPYVKHVTSGVGQFWPQGYNLNRLGRRLLDNASYQISRLYALWFQTRRFFMFFPIKANVKYVTPGWGHFWPQGHNPQGDATYQIHGSRRNGFRQEDFFIFLPI